MVRVWKNKNGQRFVTIPKRLADAMGFKEKTEGEWSVHGKGMLLLKIVK
jgi:antitoxin component of MazEF toxin-antitoxin module